MQSMGFKDTKRLYMVRPAPPALLAQSQVHAWLALHDPGIVAEQFFRASQWYIYVCGWFLFACTATSQSEVLAAARAGVM